MRYLWLLLRGTLLCCLLSASAWALNGPETATALNQRMAATPKRCAGNQPDYACSGVLVRPMAELHPVKFWEHDTDSTERGSELFVYLRRDGNTGPLPQRTGYVLMNRFDALAQGKPYEVSARPAADDVQVRNWDASVPGQLAVEALYFDPAQVGGLLRGQRAQLEWFKATGGWLPLLRMEGDGFGFDQREQLYNGYQVASAINQRFAKTDLQCPGGRARFYCQGVWVRTVDNDQYKAWNPVPTDNPNQGVSFTWFSQDGNVSKTYKNQGFILFPSDYPVTQPLPLMCIYPFDASTAGQTSPCTFRSTCASLGLNTVALWLARYRNSPHHTCSFATDPESFQLAIDIRSQGVNDAIGWNESMLAAWPQDVPAQLPLEAFIYSDAVYSPGPRPGIEGAQKFQRQYIEETRRYLPVLQFSPAAVEGQLVTYRLEDQVLN
ncbi:hypothetical protein VA602_19905 [Pseudomonas sp. MH2]|uniref:Uncharacterized protein n=1 Tax=Pseudomonas machongensis TaxID=3110229 RepID=A0ABU5VJM4_9PSED|nr:hypothetical protein [Pseudomonas sp. MH2]MEA5673585.1 hypothetical protein [Pseudomonas sp. MH2]